MHSRNPKSSTTDPVLNLGPFRSLERTVQSLACQHSKSATYKHPLQDC